MASNTELWQEARSQILSASALLEEADVALGIAIEHGDQIVDAPAPEQKSWEFRALYDINCYSLPAAFDTMNLSAIQAYQNPNGQNYQLANALAKLPAGVVGWVWMGQYTASESGGSFATSDAKLDAVMTTPATTNGLLVADQPANSHRYHIADEPNIGGLSEAGRKACIAKLAERAERITRHDPRAIVSVSEYREKNIIEIGNARPVDELWLDGYPNWTAPGNSYQEETIPNQARWADSTGIPYLAILSCHQYQDGKPGYPTPEIFAHSMDQWKQTKAIGCGVYAWDTGSKPSLSTDPTMQQAIGAEMAQVMPAQSDLYRIESLLERLIIAVEHIGKHKDHHHH